MNENKVPPKRKNIYSNPKWKEFSKNTIRELGEFCYKCERGKGHKNSDLVLQIHHVYYEAGRKPWEYDIEDLKVLCKGCHAREHDILEPSHDWILIEVAHNGSSGYRCERQKSIDKSCNVEIVYEHLVYHPKVGYRIVGFTCIDHLTESDQKISRDVRNFENKFQKRMNKLNNNSELPRGWSIPKNENLNSKHNGIRFKTTKKFNTSKEYTILADIYKQKYSHALYIKVNGREIFFINRKTNNIKKALYHSSEYALKEIIVLFDLIKSSESDDKDYLSKLYWEKLFFILKKMNFKVIKK